MAVVKPELSFEDMAPASVIGEYERLHAWATSQGDSSAASAGCNDGGTSGCTREKLQALVYPFFLYSFLAAVQHIRNSTRRCTTPEDAVSRRISENKASVVAFLNRHRDEFSTVYGDEIKEVEAAAINVMNAQNFKDDSSKDAVTIRCYMLTKFVVHTDVVTFERVRRYISESKLKCMEMILCTFILPYTKHIPSGEPPSEAPPAEPLIKRDPELMQSSSPSLQQAQSHVPLTTSTLGLSSSSSSVMSVPAVSMPALSPSLTQSASASSLVVDEYGAPPPPSLSSSSMFMSSNMAEASSNVRKRTEKVPVRSPTTVMISTFYGSEASTLSTSTFSSDGNTLVAGLTNGTMSLWRTDSSFTSGALSQHTLYGHAGPVYGTSFEKPGADWLVSCGCDGTARLWDVRERMECVSCFKGHAIGEPLWDISWSPAGRYFATAGHDKIALMWSPAERKPVRVFVGHQADVNCLCFHPNGSYLVTASEDMYARVWDVVSGNCVRMIYIHGVPTRIAVSPNGKYFVAGFYDGSVRAFDIKSGKIVDIRQSPAALYSRACEPVYALAFNYDGTALAVGSEDSSVRVWDTSDGSLPFLGFNYLYSQTYYTRNTPIYALRYISPNLLIGAGPYKKVLN